MGVLANWIGNLGKGVVNMFGSGVAGARDLGAMIGGTYDWNNKDNNETAKWQMFMTGADNARDAQIKSAGQALNSATSLSDLAIGMATGGTGSALTKGLGAVATNALQGAAGGFADELEQNGENWDARNAGIRMASGMASGAATAGLSNGIGKAMSGNAGKIGSKLLDNKLTNSAIGRGALSGAVGGAVGGGTMAGLTGGDVLGTALSTGLDGAFGGAVTGGVMSAAQKAGNKAISKIWSAEQNKSFQNAIANPSKMKGSIYLGEVSDESLNGIKQAYADAGIDLDANPDAISAVKVENGKLYLTQNGAQHLNERRIQKGGMSAKSVRQTMRNATQNGTVFPDLSTGGNATMGASTDSKKIDIAHLGVNDDGSLELKSTYPVSSGKTYQQAKNTLDGSLVHHATDANSNGLAAGSSALQGDGSIVSQNNNDVKNGLMYGESDLGNRTRKGMVAEKLEQFGNSLEGAQTNVTRAATRDLGIESTGAVIENVRKKTGLTNLETQAQLAKELTGGDSSLMDSVQRIALSASENGKPYRVDTTGLLGEVEQIVNKYADSNTFSNKDQFIKNLKANINNPDMDVISISNRMKSIAADARGKGIVNPSPKDSATAKIYNEVAHKLDDLSYNSIPKENINDMFDVTISEMRGRAKQAMQNGNKDIAKAYNTLADNLDAEPRTIKAFRSFKKDFVDVSKIGTLTAQAENGAAVQMGRGFSGGVKRFTDALLQTPMEWAAAKVGGAVNDVATKLDNGINSSRLSSASVAPDVNAQLPNNVYNAIGRETGRAEANDVENTQNAQVQAAQEQTALQAMQQAQNVPKFQLEDGRLVTIEETEAALQRAYEANDMASYNELGQIYQTLQAASANGATGTVGNIETLRQQSQATNIKSQLQQVAELALQAGDIKAFNQAATLYKAASAMFDTEELEQVKLSGSQQTQVQNLDSSLNSLDQMEALFTEAGGGKGLVGGSLENLANFVTGGSANKNLSVYNSMKESLGMAIVKNFVNLGATESDAKRYAAMLPDITDNSEVAAAKINQLRTLINQARQNVYNVASGTANTALGNNGNYGGVY